MPNSITWADLLWMTVVCVAIAICGLVSCIAGRAEIYKLSTGVGVVAILASIMTYAYFLLCFASEQLELTIAAILVAVLIIVLLVAVLCDAYNGNSLGKNGRLAVGMLLVALVGIVRSVWPLWANVMLVAVAVAILGRECRGM